MSPAEAARGVKMLALDVDGVLTDNAIYLGLVGGQRVEFKRFDIQDGLGLGDVRQRKRQAAIDTECPVAGGRRRRHAKTPVVVDIRRP